MRSREVIERTQNFAPKMECMVQNQKLMLEVLLDVRDYMAEAYLANKRPSAPEVPLQS